VSKHFISKAAVNATTALMDAMELWQEELDGFVYDLNGVAELVGLINKASIDLAKLTRVVKYERERRKRIRAKA
jgi:hypothetical protein